MNRKNFADADDEVGEANQLITSEGTRLIGLQKNLQELAGPSNFNRQHPTVFIEELKEEDQVSQNQYDDDESDGLSGYYNNTQKENSETDSDHEKKQKQLFRGVNGIDQAADSEDNLSVSEQSNSEARVKRRSKNRGSKTNARQVNDKKIAAMNINKQGDNMNFKRSIEIRNGIAIRSTNNVNSMTNAITLHLYIGLYGVFLFLTDVVFQRDHLILLANLMLEILSGNETLREYSHIIATAIISFLGTGIMNLLADLKLKEMGDSVNQKPIEQFVISKKSRRFVISSWAQIQCGDIIKIKMNQEIPCDALILDIVGSRFANQTCYTRGGLFDDDSNPSLKRSYQGTMNKTGQRIQASKFVDLISGMLKWEYNHQGYFTGRFKQENSPTAFEITPDNIVQRGCYMQQATQAICLALNVGPNTMGNQYYDENQNRFQAFLQRRTKRNHFESVHFTALKIIQLASIVFCLVPCILIVLQDLLLKNLQVSRFGSNVVEMSSKVSVQNYIIILSGFLQNFPYLAKLTMDAVIFFHAYFTIWDINLVPAQLNYNDLKIMKSMGQIDSIVCPKSAFLQHNTSFPAAFQINNQAFFNQNEKNERRTQFKGSEQNETGDDIQPSSDEDVAGMIDYLPNQIFFDPAFHSHYAQSLFNETGTKDSDQFRELLLGLVLCHHATHQKRNTSGSKEGYARQTYKSLYKDEEAQLHFAHSFEYRFLKRKKRKVTIQQEGVKRHFDEFLIRRIKVGDDYLVVSVIKPQGQQDCGLTIYYRANLRLLNKFLPPYDQKTCKSAFQKFKSQGIHAYGIAKHVVQPEDALTFLRIINDEKDKNEKFLLRLAKDLQFIGMIGLQVAFNYRDTLLIEDLRRNGIKLYMLSNEDYDNVQTDCNAMNLLEGFTDPIIVKGTTERQVEDSLKSCLKEVLKRRVESASGEAAGVNQQRRPKNKKQNNKGSKSKLPDGGDFRRRKTKNDKMGEQDEKSNKYDWDYKAADVDKIKETNVLFFQGTQLQFILRDQTLEKLFLSLCNLCSLCIGSSVTPMQRKFVVRAIRQFAVQGKLGNVISIISSQTEKMTIEEADITVGLIQNYKQSDVLARTDVQMKNLYGLTYLFFRHGTLAHRRAKVVLTEFIGRTVTTQLISIYFFILQGFSYQLPYGRIFFSFYMAVQTPIQFWLQGISHTNYGYNVYHRIFGEYRFNLTQQVSIKDFFEVFANSSIDAFFFMLCYMAAGLLGSDYQVNAFDGTEVSWQTHMILNNVLLAVLNLTRSRSIKSNVLIVEILNYVLATMALIMVLEDPDLAGLHFAVRSPHVIGCVIFIFLYGQLKQFIRLVYEIVLPWNRKHEMRYKAIEDKIFMEEYENPEQQFSITSLESYAQVAKSLEANSIFSINQNLLIVHRTDSMDHILERLNYQSSRISEDHIGGGGFSDNVSAFINTKNLKLHDINKEIEYNQTSESLRQVVAIVPLIWSSFVLFSGLLLFKVTNSIVESRFSTSNTTTSSSTLGSTAQTSYFEVFQAALSLGVIHAIKSTRYRRPFLLTMFLIFISNLMIVMKFYGDLESPLIQVQFLYTIAFSFGIRLTSFYLVSMIAVGASVAFLQLRLSVIVARTQDENSSSMLQLSWMIGVMMFYVFLWIYYAYQDELRRKVNFVTQYRRVKEFQKLKSITNILIPSIVRDRLQDGKKIQADQRSFATVLWAEIDDFDFLVRKYHGRDFTELLEKVYNGLDNLCEQYGLQVIETVGKAFVACGGIKFFEKNLDPRLLTSYHSVRVIEFAVKAQNFVKSITLHDGRVASIKIGIHSGSIMCGVIGDIKPQFCIIGNVVDKAAAICRISQNGSIHISSQSYSRVVNKVNNFLFEEQEMKIESQSHKVYSVQKRRGGKKRLADQRDFKYGGKNIQGTQRLIEETPAFAGLIGPALIEEQEQKRLLKKLDSDDEEHTEEIDQMANSDQFADSGCENVNRSEQMINESWQEADDDEKHSLDGSFEDDVNRRNFSDHQDDRKIVKIAALNDKYKLVERPRFLFQFEYSVWESKFGCWVFRKHFSTELVTFIMKSIFDVVITQAAVIGQNRWDRLDLNAIVGVAMCLLKTFEILGIFCRKVKKPRYIIYQFCSFLGSFFTIVLIGPLGLNFVYREAIEVTFAMYMMLAFLTRSFQFKIYAVLISLSSTTFIATNYHGVVMQTVNLQTYVVESLMNLTFVGFLIVMIYTREMRLRKSYNSERIVEVEIRLTEELLSKLVPDHALTGIKNDSKVIDLLDNVSIIYAKLVGFDDYCKAVKTPNQVIGLLSRLYSKFDNLCEQYSIYKVHTLGDTYVIIGYRGKIAGEKRTTEDAVSEAYSMLQAAHQICEIVSEERERMKDPKLLNLDVRVGLNSGKIVAGIIGTKVVRYDIFGQDVLMANLIMRSAAPGSVVVSESFRRMIQRRPFVYDTFDWQEYKPVKVPETDDVTQTYTSEQIFAELDSFSEADEMEQQMASLNNVNNGGNENTGDPTTKQ